jgi:ubiquinone/menaquinone biosynthesis C-methylase UbiE
MQDGWRTKSYSTEYLKEQRSTFRKQVYDPLVWKFTEKYLPPKASSILDAGGGSGYWAKRFCDLGYRITLVDYSSYMINEASKTLKQFSNAHSLCGDVRKLPFQNNAFDFIFCEADPISQCGSKKESVRAIKELGRVLRVGSVMVGSVSLRYFWLLKKVLKAKTSGQLKEALHLLKSGNLVIKSNFKMYLFRPDELSKTFEAYGFKILEMVPLISLSQFISERAPNNPEILYQIERQVRMSRVEMLALARRAQFAVKRTI